MNDVAKQISHDIVSRIKEGQSRFDQYFATLSFGALALSLQFSQREHSSCRWLLIASWVLYLATALLAGWRMLASPQFDKISWAQSELDGSVKQRRIRLTDPVFLAALEAKNVVDPDTAKTVTKDDVIRGLAREEANLREASRNLANLQSRLKFRFQVSLWLLVFAFLLNGTYVAVNFLKSP
jgi:hypothetical protein